jgi:trimeric autotransporter adhesin
VAGTGSYGYSGDGGQATSAVFSSPDDVTADASGNIYIADSANNRIRMVTKSTGIISTVAGTGSSGYSGDGGQATSAALNYPRGITADTSGNIYIADTYNHRIRMVMKSTGIISTVAGTGYSGYSGDGGQATSSTLYNPRTVATDESGNIYIADSSNNRVRMVTKSTGIISTVAGTGSSGYSGDGGQATSAALYYSCGVAVDASGNIYIADTDSYRIRMVTKSTGIISTVAGTGSYSSSGDGGQATSATLYNPRGVTIDASGSVYVADAGNNRIRMFSLSGSTRTASSPLGIVIPSPSASSSLVILSAVLKTSALFVKKFIDWSIFALN